jgi:hypothetical protein
MFLNSPFLVVLQLRDKLSIILQCWEGMLFIEVKWELGTIEEHLNAIAQVIAESDGMQSSPCPAATLAKRYSL